MKKYKVYIGIDCGVKTGFAIWDTESKNLETKSTFIHKAMDSVKAAKSIYGDGVFVKVEDARKAVFGRSKDWFKAQGAGSVKRDAQIWEDFLTDLGVDLKW